MTEIGGPKKILPANRKYVRRILSSTPSGPPHQAAIIIPIEKNAVRPQDMAAHRKIPLSAVNEGGDRKDDTNYSRPEEYRPIMRISKKFPSAGSPGPFFLAFLLVNRLMRKFPLETRLSLDSKIIEKIVAQPRDQDSSF